MCKAAFLYYSSVGLNPQNTAFFQSLSYLNIPLIHSKFQQLLRSKQFPAIHRFEKDTVNSWLSSDYNFDETSSSFHQTLTMSFTY